MTGICKCLRFCFLLWKHIHAGCRQDKWDCQWLSEVNLPHFEKAFDVWLENKTCLIKGHACALAIFINYLRSAHFLISTLAPSYIKITENCQQIYFRISSQSTRWYCQNLNHYRCKTTQPRRILTLSWPGENAVFKPNFVKFGLSASRVASDSNQGQEGANTLHSADWGLLAEVRHFKGEIRLADKVLEAM